MRTEIFIYANCPKCNKEIEESFFDANEETHGAIELLGQKERHCECGESFNIKIKGEIVVSQQV